MTLRKAWRRPPRPPWAVLTSPHLLRWAALLLLSTAWAAAAAAARTPDSATGVSTLQSSLPLTQHLAPAAQPPAGSAPVPNGRPAAGSLASPASLAQGSSAASLRPSDTRPAPHLTDAGQPEADRAAAQDSLAIASSLATHGGGAPLSSLAGASSKAAASSLAADGSLVAASSAAGRDSTARARSAAASEISASRDRQAGLQRSAAARRLEQNEAPAGTSAEAEEGHRAAQTRSAAGSAALNRGPGASIEQVRAGSRQRQLQQEGEGAAGSSDEIPAAEKEAAAGAIKELQQKCQHPDYEKEQPPAMYAWPFGDRDGLLEVAMRELAGHLAAPHHEAAKAHPQEHLTRGTRHELLRRLFAQPLALSPQQLRQGMTLAGNGCRLRRALAKLLEGRAVSVTTLGGSVTAGSGLRRFEDTYVGKLFAWINATFPHAEHRLHNGGLTATSSAFLSECLNNFITPPLDLVFVEFATNDWFESPTTTWTGARQRPWMNNNMRRGLERLVRKLLALPGEPAVVFLHWFSPLLHGRMAFWQAAEDEMNVIGEYYGLQALSFRNAFFHSIAANATGFTIPDVMCDAIHPNQLGSTYLAHLAIGLLQLSAAPLVYLPLDELSKPCADLPLAAPMFEGNWEGDTQCIKGDAFRQLVTNVRGFQWINEGKDEAHPKWGYISARPGDSLDIAVSSAVAPASGRNVTVGVGLVFSYEHMGVALLTCVQGCVCAPREADGIIWTKHTAEYWDYMLVTQSPDCVIRVTVAVRTSSGEHKVKVTSVMTTEDDYDSRVEFNGFVGEVEPRTLQTHQTADDWYRRRRRLGSGG